MVLISLSLSRSLRSMTSKTCTTTNPLPDSPPLLPNHTDTHSPTITTDLSASSTSIGSCTVNGPTCAGESSNHRLHLSAAIASSSSSTSSLGGGHSHQERSSSTSSIKDYYLSGNPSMSCSIPALTNIPISKHLRSSGGGGGSGLKIGRQLNNSETASSSTAPSSSFHVSFHGLGRDSFRLTNSERTGFIDLATAAATISNKNNNGRGNLVTDGQGSSVFNHNGTANTSSVLPKSTSASSKSDANSLVLRSGTAANLRHRPYSVNHKTATKSSS